MELPQIGKHCTASSCSTLDFLPIVCQKCHKVYCKDHSSPLSGHECIGLKDIIVPECPNCKKKLKPVETSKEEELMIKSHLESNCKSDLFDIKPSQKIACNVCKILDIPQAMVICIDCHETHCLKHRGDHECPRVALKEQAKLEKKQEISAFVEGKLKRPAGNLVKPAKKKSLSPQVELMLLKSTAKGDSIPDNVKVYCRVWFEKSEVPQGQLPLYLHQDWTVGKVIDWIASRAKLQNVNNLGDDSKKLNIYSNKGQRLATSSTLKSLIDAGEVQNGGGLIMLRGAGQEIDSSLYI